MGLAAATARGGMGELRRADEAPCPPPSAPHGSDEEVGSSTEVSRSADVLGESGYVGVAPTDEFGARLDGAMARATAAERGPPAGAATESGVDAADAPSEPNESSCSAASE